MPDAWATRVCRAPASASGTHSVIWQSETDLEIGCEFLTLGDKASVLFASLLQLHLELIVRRVCLYTLRDGRFNFALWTLCVSGTSSLSRRHAETDLDLAVEIRYCLHLFLKHTFAFHCRLHGGRGFVLDSRRRLVLRQNAVEFGL